MSKRTLKDVLKKILTDEFEDIKETLYASDGFEVINAIYECYCGFYWTGNSIRVGITDGDDSFKDKVCYNCGIKIFEAKRLLKGKIKFQEIKKPEVEIKQRLLDNADKLGNDEKPSQIETLGKSHITYEEAVYIMETAQIHKEYILSNLPDREKRAPTKVVMIGNMIDGNSNFLTGLRKGRIQSSKQTYRIKQFRDILKDGGFLNN